MGEIRIEHITKKFNDFTAVDDLSVHIHNGEFFTILGPSGCGKTTMLRMVAGFIKPTEGEITINQSVISSSEKGIFIPPEKRNIGMVFQSYAVWPHMTVFDNVAYPLKIKKLPKKEIREKTEQILSLTGLKDLTYRYPYQLSGGQQQRVALARSLVMNPPVLLLDEPLSNLDAKLKEKMRFEIKELQRRIGVTIIYVTHDQSEALVMSDRMMVMNAGTIQQVGTPEEIYANPENTFVADFIGLTNLVSCELKEGKACFGGNELLLDSSQAIEGEVFMSIRPSEITIHQQKEVPKTLKGVVDRAVYLGDIMDYLITVSGVTFRVQSKNRSIRNGDTVWMELDQENLLFFPK